MLSEDRQEKLRNVACNFMNITMGAMMNMMGEVMGGFAQTMADAFAAVADGGEGGKDDVLAKIRANAPQQMLEMFAQEPQEDKEQFQQHCQLLSDEDIDPLAEQIEALRIPLPAFTTKLSPESLLGYYYLCQQEDPEVGKLLEAVGGWMQTMGEKMGDPPAAEA